MVIDNSYTIIKWLAILLLSLLCQACIKKKLPKEAREWQPYQVGDLLVFRTPQGKLDSIIIDKIESFYNPKDPLSFNATEYEALYVSGVFKSDDLINNGNEKPVNQRVNVFQMSRGKEDVYLRFIFNNTYDSLTYPKTILRLTDFEKLFDIFPLTSSLT